jgi:hypothetical protein
LKRKLETDTQKIRDDRVTKTERVVKIVVALRMRSVGMSKDHKKCQECLTEQRQSEMPGEIDRVSEGCIEAEECHTNGLPEIGKLCALGGWSLIFEMKV